ncbi:MAG: AEC family transporter [Thiolinea sp.]
MLENLAFSFGVTGPIFLIILTGITLKRVGLINNEFARLGSDLAFKVAMPCLLFTKLIDVSFSNPPLFLLGYALAATVATFVLLEWLAAGWLPQNDRSAFVQGAFRGNMGIVGLAFALNAYGDKILPVASVYIAAMTILFNVLSLITLNRHLPVEKRGSPVLILLKKISSNPLIIAIIMALLVSWQGIPVPDMMLKTMDYFAAMALPLALLCGGAAIRWREFHSSVNLYWGTLAKLVLVPGLIVTVGVLLGIRGESLGVLFFMTAAPTASASYPMIRSMGGNHYLAAALIALTSLLSVVAVTAGLFLLRELGLA